MPPLRAATLFSGRDGILPPALHSQACAWERSIVPGVSTPLPPCRAAGSATGKRGELFERSEFSPRRLRSATTGVVRAAGLPFSLVTFFWASKRKSRLPARERPLVVRTHAHAMIPITLDCRVAALLAMTAKKNGQCSVNAHLFTEITTSPGQTFLGFPVALAGFFQNLRRHRRRGRLLVPGKP